jgi:hypothetical protein
MPVPGGRSARARRRGLLANKTATGRVKDLADVEELRTLLKLKTDGGRGSSS